MMRAEITPSALGGTISAISSKSFAHRILLAAARAKENSVVRNLHLSADISATVNCLNALGADIGVEGETAFVRPIRSVPESAVLPVGESGSTYRFILPYAASLGVNARLTGSDRLFERPSEPLIDALSRHGVTSDGKSLSGRLLPGEYSIRGGISSQFITGLLFALPALNGDSRIVVEGEKVSSGYLKITSEILSEFGIEITEDFNSYYVRGNQSFSAHDTRVEGDWSNAAFFLVAGAIGGSVSVAGLKRDSAQGDAKIAEILAAMGAEVAFDGDRVAVGKGKLVGGRFAVGEIPDLVPVLAVTAAFAEGDSVFDGVSRLRYKECDRLAAVIDLLARAGIRAETDGDTLCVHGGVPRGGRFFGYGDHRMVMSAAVLAAYAEGRSFIAGAGAVTKSYPHFFDDFNCLGGKAYVSMEG